MDKRYLTLLGEGTARFTERKSEFIGRAAPAADAGEAEAFIARIKAENADASHNAWAYRIDDSAMRASDDGEPSGTAGAPLLRVLCTCGLCRAAVTVTRHFGGILLGAGGLIRAYGEAAAQAVKAAGVVTVAPFSRFLLRLPYSLEGKARSALRQMGAEVLGCEFTDEVRLDVCVPEESGERLRLVMADLSAARARTEYTGRTFRPLK